MSIVAQYNLPTCGSTFAEASYTVVEKDTGGPPPPKDAHIEVIDVEHELQSLVPPAVAVAAATTAASTGAPPRTAAPTRGAAPAAATANANDVTVGALSLQIEGLQQGTRWSNAFFQDRGIPIRVKLDAHGAVRVTGHITRHNNQSVTNSPETIVFEQPVDPPKDTVNFQASYANTSLPGLDIERDIALLTVSQVKANGTLKALATIQMTPRPNLIRITDQPLKGKQPTFPSAISSLNPNRKDGLSGGAMQVVAIGGKAPEPVSAGVYHVVNTGPEAFFKYDEHIAIPEQPVRFRLHFANGSLLSFAGSHPTTNYARTDKSGVVSQDAQVGNTPLNDALQTFQDGGYDYDGLLGLAGGLTGIEAGVAGGTVVEGEPDAGQVKMVIDVSPRSVQGQNDRDPRPADQKQLQGVDELPVGDIRQLLDVILRKNVLQASPFFTSIPDSTLGDGFGDAFRSGEIRFHIVPVRRVSRIKAIHIAASDQAKVVLRMLNRSVSGMGATSSTALLDVAGVLRQSEKTVVKLWTREYKVPVTLHTDFSEFPPASPGVINVAILSAASGGADRTRLTTAVMPGDGDPANSLSAALDPSSVPSGILGVPGAPGLAFSVEGTPFPLKPLETDFNRLIFRPSGAQRNVAIGTVVFAEAFGWLQEDRTPRTTQDLGTYIGNVIAHEAGHHYGLVGPWSFSPTEATGQQRHTPFRRNRILYRLYRSSLMVPGITVIRTIPTIQLLPDPIEHQYLKLVTP